MTDNQSFLEPASVHLHSKYSMLDAIPSPKEWVFWALENNVPAISVTDHGTAISLYDVLKFPSYIEEYNKNHKTSFPLDAVIPIPGVEVYVKLNETDDSHYHLIIWAVTNEGYFNLMKLASIAYDDQVSYYGSIKARLTFDQILAHKAGLKFGTACIASPLGKAILLDDYKLAEERFLTYKSMFGDDLYVEFHPNDLCYNFNKKTGGFDLIPPTSLAPDSNNQRAYNRFLMDMIIKYGGKAIPATDAHFINPEDKILQDILLKCGNDNGWYFAESYHQMKAQEIYDRLKVHLDGYEFNEEIFAQWIANTHELMNMAKTIQINFTYHLPKIKIPKHIQDRTSDYDMQTYYLTMEKVQKHGRWRDDPVYIARFKKEIDVILKNKTMNFLPYFLLYEDIGTYARSEGILQNIGRGSAGGCLLSYYLKIIHVDPIAEDLPFERFLSHARIGAGSFPDIDADFGSRDKILTYLEQEYGLGFAQIATFQTMKTKNAIKDTMWALHGRNRNDPEIRAICNTIPDSPQGIAEYDFLYGYTDSEGIEHQGQIDENQDLKRFFVQYPDVEKMVSRLVGIMRGFGRHASGFVVSSLDLSGERVPTMKMYDKQLGSFVLVTQYSAPMVEKSKLIKADILGVKTIQMVSDAIKYIKERHNEDLLEEDEYGVAQIYRLPEDKSVFTDFYNKKTDSSFQFNTDLVKAYLPQFAPTRKNDLSILTALVRPGSLDAKFKGTTATQYYVDVRNGVRDIEYVHPDMESILKDTNGIFVFQEDVFKFLVNIVDYSWEESDTVRSAIAKKKREVILKTFDRIREATHKRGWTPEQSEEICNQVEAFSRYSFNKSHSKCYGDLGYITVYLKHYYTLEWWTAVLNNIDDEDRIRKYISVLGGMVKPPSLKKPSKVFTIQDDCIRAPLSVLRGIGPATVDELVTKGPFTDFDDFLAKINHSRLNVGHFASLIKSRSADCFMDKTIDYLEARKNLMIEYMEKRKSKPIDPDLINADYFNIYLMEKEANFCFNKALLDDDVIVHQLITKWPALQRTGKKGIPLMMGETPVLNSCRVAEGLVDKEYTDEVGLILLYESSSYAGGISKKSGKPWHKVSVMLSDGYNTIECIMWDHKKALGWDKNTVVYVKGKLSRGWKDKIQLTVSEMEKIHD